MSEFIKIGEVANLFNTIKCESTPVIGSSVTSNPTTVKKSGNGLAFAVGIVLAGIVGYEFYLYFKKKKAEKDNKI